MRVDSSGQARKHVWTTTRTYLWIGCKVCCVGVGLPFYFSSRICQELIHKCKE